MNVKRYFFACFSMSLIISLGNVKAQSSFINKSNGKDFNRGALLDNPKARKELEWLQLRNPATGRIPANIRQKELRFAKTLPTKEQLMMQMKKSGHTNIQNYTWTQRGPYNIGGRTRALAIDVNDENTLLAGGVNGGMWKSTDDGATWSEKTSPGDLQSVTCIAQDTRAGKTNTWYYGTGEFTVFPGGFVNSAAAGIGFDSSLMFLGNGIFKSTDDGNSWSVLPSTLKPSGRYYGPFSIVYNIVTNPANPNQDEVLAATYAGIMRSTDGGTTWDTTLPNFLGEYTNIAVTSKGVFYAALNFGALPLIGGIFRSTDGVNWINITPDNFPFNTNQTAIAIAPSDENVVYFLSDTSSGFTDGHVLWKYTYVSGDGTGSGGSWENRSANLPSQGTVFMDSQYGYCLSLSVKPDDENTVFLGEIDLFRSTDGFASTLNTTILNDSLKQGFQYNTDHVDHHAIIFSKSNPNIMYVADDGGVFKTYNDMDSPPVWTSLNNGYYTTQFYSVAINHTTTDNIIIAGAQDNGTVFTNSNSTTAKWNEIYGGDGTFCYIPDDGSSYYVSHQFGNVGRVLLDNNGNILSSGAIYPPLGSSGQIAILGPYVIDPNDNKVIYYAQGDYIWRNSDVTAIPLNGQPTATNINWTELNNTSTSGSNISAVGISKTPADRIYYGTADGKIFRLDNANSTNSTPVDIYTNKGLPSVAFVFCIAVDQNDGDKAIVSFSNYWVKSLFYTTDAGNTWTSISGNLEQYPDGSGDGPSTRWVKILHINGSNIYFVGTSTGVYSTTNLNGDKTVWAQEGASTIGNAVVDAIDARSTDGLVVVATHGKGIYSTHVNTNATTDSSDILVSFDNNVTPTSGIFSQLPNKNTVIANRLTAPLSTFKITKLMYYITRDHSGGAGSFTPYEDECVNYSNGALGPATYGFEFNNITPSNMPGWVTVNVSIPVTPSPQYVDKEFFVGVEYDGSHEPAIGYDSTSSNGRGWYRGGDIYTNWTQLDSIGWHVTLYIRAVISTVTSVEDISSVVPKYFGLMQNYPNPFNPSTTIEYDLPKAESVRLKIYDILGREVATLVEAEQNAGIYKVQWNGRNNYGVSVASGIYLYLFEAGNYRSVKKMIYLK